MGLIGPIRLISHIQIPMLTFDDILQARQRLRGVAHRTPVLTSKQFN